MTLTRGPDSGGRVTWRLHPLEPDLVPIRVDGSRTEHPLVAEAAAAYRTLEDETRVGHADHPARLLVHDVVYAAQHAKRLPAVRHHLDVEREPAIARAGVQRLHDCIVRPHPHELA